VDKTIVYLDQMAISNMTKILHPELGVGREIDPFWREMFERIDLLSKLQVLVCPDSQTHRESELAPYAAELKRIYELFSHGTTFDFGTNVLERQLLEYLQNWLGGYPDRPPDLTPATVIDGQLHGWLERFTITVGGLQGDDWVGQDARRAHRVTVTSVGRSSLAHDGIKRPLTSEGRRTEDDGGVDLGLGCASRASIPLMSSGWIWLPYRNRRIPTRFPVSPACDRRLDADI
jgi:hypothetical protein